MSQNVFKVLLIFVFSHFLEIPMGRLGTTEEIAETVLWMVKTGYVTNKIVGVDGGMFPQ